MLGFSGYILLVSAKHTGMKPCNFSETAPVTNDHPEYLYNPRENTTEQSWTRSPVPGNRLADKPAYVLTSARTFSGAEQFCYGLKMLKRVTLVGERTGGAGHSGVWLALMITSEWAFLKRKPSIPSQNPIGQR